MLTQERLAKLDLPGLAPSRNISDMLQQDTNLIHAIQILDARTKELAKPHPAEKRTINALDSIPSGMDEEPDGEPLAAPSDSSSSSPAVYSGPFKVSLSGTTASISSGTAYFNGTIVTCEAGTVQNIPDDTDGYILLTITMSNADTTSPTYTPAYSFSTSSVVSMPDEDLSVSTPQTVASSIPLAQIVSGSVRQIQHGFPHLFAFAHV